MVLRILYIFPSEELSLKSPRSGSHCSAVMYFQTPEELRRVMSEKEPHSVAILWVTLGSIICGIMAACGLYPLWAMEGCPQTVHFQLACS